MGDLKVVNVRVKYIRPKYANLKEWMEDEQNVYIGRAGIVFIDGKRYPRESSVWNNTFKIGKDGDRAQVLEKYKEYIAGRLELEPELCEKLSYLKGKTLGCWCAPERCHGDILYELSKLARLNRAELNS
jgi:hypothetical protein